MGVVLICGLWMFVACTNDDNPVVKPDMEQLQDGEWTGGLHGANRLGGNGVADIVVNGRLAGIAAAERALK